MVARPTLGLEVGGSIPPLADTLTGVDEIGKARKRKTLAARKDGRICKRKFNGQNALRIETGTGAGSSPAACAISYSAPPEATGGKNRARLNYPFSGMVCLAFLFYITPAAEWRKL